MLTINRRFPSRFAEKKLSWTGSLQSNFGAYRLPSRPRAINYFLVFAILFLLGGPRACAQLSQISLSFEGSTTCYGGGTYPPKSIPSGPPGFIGTGMANVFNFSTDGRSVQAILADGGTLGISWTNATGNITGCDVTDSEPFSAGVVLQISPGGTGVVSIIDADSGYYYNNPSSGVGLAVRMVYPTSLGASVKVTQTGISFNGTLEVGTNSGYVEAVGNGTAFGVPNQDSSLPANWVGTPFHFSFTVPLVQGCGDVRDEIIAEYNLSYSITNKKGVLVSVKPDFVPICSNFSNSARSTYFNFSEINWGDYSWALVRTPLTTGKLDAWINEQGGAPARPITSGYRNPAHNFNKVHSTAPGSRHMHGDAIDLANISRTVTEHNFLTETAYAVGAWVEHLSGPCKLGCVHADWRNTDPGEYAQ
jgi:hypothetical protein